jgi:hypothetical protein
MKKIKPRIVICNGGYRTGSTTVYNICKLLIEKSNKALKSSLYPESYMKELVESEPAIWHNCKIHNWIPDIITPYVKIIHSYRNPFDSAASWYSRYQCGERHGLFTTGNQFDIEKIISFNLKQVESIKLNKKIKSSLLIPYNEILCLEKVVSKISKYLELDTDDKTIDEISNKLDINKIKAFSHEMKEDHDSKTQFRKWHVSKHTSGNPEGYKNMPEEMTSRLIEEFGEYDSWKL